MLITHARLATLGAAPRLIDDGALFIKGDRIAALGTSAELAARYPAAERLGRGRAAGPPGGHLCPHPLLRGLCPRHGHPG